MMKMNKILILLPAMLVVLASCQKHLESLNVNPNGADPSTTNPQLVLSTVLTQSAITFVSLGYGDIAGVMQHTQKTAGAGSHNNYDWGNTNSWTSYYDILRNNKFVYDKAVASGDKGLQAITLVMKSLMFGLITDLWGDVPYTSALNGDQGGSTNTFPTYDSQQSIYQGILADLDTANTMLSNNESSDIGAADVYYNGDLTKWRKFTNSLALRYYMRLSNKLPAVAQAGIEKIVGDPTKYPIITTSGDDAAMSFPGTGSADSWPNYAVPGSDSSSYISIEMCNTLVMELLNLNDPRIAKFAEKVQISLLVDPTLTGSVDRIVVDTVINGELRTVRILSLQTLVTSNLTLNDINQDPNYVGLPVALNAPFTYNMSPDTRQGGHNPHVSWVNLTFANGKGVPARVMSAAEVNFILAEASAVYGWNAGDAQTNYNAAIKASFDVWGLASNYAAYIAQPEVAFNGTQNQILTQKWLASWSVATEAWFDWRRTGLPELHGVLNRTIAPELPLRFYYPLEERNLNSTNVLNAENSLETTIYSGLGQDNAKNSPWSRPWVVQGTGKPW
jgi:hypothetical protein